MWRGCHIGPPTRGPQGAESLFAFAALSALAIALSFAARNPLCAWLLRWGGGYLLVSLAALTVFGAGCTYTDFRFRACAYGWMEAIAGPMSAWNTFTVIVLTLLAPLIAGLALVLEITTRLTGEMRGGD